MKKELVMTWIFLCSVGVAFAQDNKSNNPTNSNSYTTINSNNELKLNLAFTVFAVPEISYERILNENMAAGLSVMARLNNKDGEYFSVIPYYRLYFGVKKAAGFFIEGNAAYISSKDYNNVYNSSGVQVSSSATKRYADFGFGLAVGSKVMTRNGFIGEAYVGYGKTIANHNIAYFPRVGISIGKRF